MVIRWNVTIPQLTGDQPRTAYVYLPTCYESDPQRRFPVLYMFDGHNVFFDSDATYGKCWGMKTFMDREALKLIIVAVAAIIRGKLKEQKAAKAQAEAITPNTEDNHEEGNI